MNVDRHDPAKYQPEYDVTIRRFSEMMSLTSPRKEKMGAALSIVQPGETCREHSHDLEEMFMIVDGSVEFRLDGESVMVNANDFVFAEAGQKHSFTNHGDQEIRVFSFWWMPVRDQSAA